LDFLQEFLLSIWEAVRNGTKIPVGKWAKQAVDWLIDTAGFLFDWLSAVLKTMIDGLVWLLELPHPFLFTALVVALALWLKRSVPLAVFVALSLLFIINQGYWDDMIKTLALIIAAAVVCMAVGVPMGIAAAHRPEAFSLPAAGARPDADDPDLRLSDPGADPVRSRHGARSGRHGDLRHSGPIRLTQLGVKSTPQVGRGGRGLWCNADAAACGRWNCPMRCRRSWPG
jgi:glycine betaine/proline transport system permease protein